MRPGTIPALVVYATRTRIGKATIMMNLNQSIVWIDDTEARIMTVERGLRHKLTIHAAAERVPDSPAANDRLASDAPTGYFHRVARALDWADEILIVGPSATKVAFLKYMHKDDHAIDPRILGIETIAHPTDLELEGFAKLYFTVGGPRRSANGSDTIGDGFEHPTLRGQPTLRGRP